MRFARWTAALAAFAGLATGPALAGTVSLTGTRSNISPGGSPSGRCAPALTVSFGPTAFAATGTSTVGDFTYVASHCIAGPPPGSYYDGLFTWTLATGTLSGTYTGSLAASGTQGTFNVAENLLFTGGTGQFAGASGFANAVGTVSFGQFNGTPASFGNVRFTGQLTAAGVPEPATLGLLLGSLGMAAVVVRRRRPDAA